MTQDSYCRKSGTGRHEPTDGRLNTVTTCQYCGAVTKDESDKLSLEPDVPEITRPFRVDAANAGVIRGGWMDDEGGILVGRYAEWVCKVLNGAFQETDSG